jgi:uncharacterized protein YbcI
VDLQDPGPARDQSTRAINDAVADLMQTYTGVMPAETQTTINDHVVTVVLRDTLIKAEQRLVQQGQGRAVIDMRRRFQQSMRDELVAAVEAHTGRTVEAFLSANGVEPDIAVEIFILERRTAR